VEIQKVLEAMTDKLTDVANGDAVMGTPIKLGDTTIIPVSRMSVSFGAGGGEGEGDVPKTAKTPAGSGAGVGYGGGGGAKVRPVAVIVISSEGVNVMPVPDRKGKLDALLEKIPEFIEQIQKKLEK